MHPAWAASLSGWVITSRQRWMTQFSRVLWAALSLARNLGHGKRVVRMKVWLEDFIRVSICIFARLRSTRWATRSPVMTEIFVLSDERMTPRRVAPSGRIDYVLCQASNLKVQRRNKPAFPMQRCQLSILCKCESFFQHLDKVGWGRSP